MHHRASWLPCLAGGMRSTTREPSDPRTQESVECQVVANQTLFSTWACYPYQTTHPGPNQEYEVENHRSVLRAPPGAIFTRALRVPRPWSGPS